MDFDGNIEIEVSGRYTGICTSIIEDERLSWKAKGLMAYLVGRPKGWVLNRSDLINRSTDGRDSVAAGLKELSDLGYISVRQVKDQGRFGKTVWMVQNSPLPDFPSTEDRSTEKQSTENPPLVNTNVVNSNVTTSKERIRQDDPLFDMAMALYPKRGGGNPRALALKAWNKRVKDGVSRDDMIDGVKRYAAYVRATGVEGTVFVMQASTFFGPSDRYSEKYDVPEEKKDLRDERRDGKRRIMQAFSGKKAAAEKKGGDDGSIETSFRRVD